MWAAFVIYLGGTLLSLKPIIASLAIIGALLTSAALLGETVIRVYPQEGKPLTGDDLNINLKLDQVQRLLSVKKVIILCIFAIMIPSKDTIKYMVGGAIVWNGAVAVQKIENINKLPTKFIEVANKYLDTIASDFEKDIIADKNIQISK